MNHDTCIFCRIIAQEIPAGRIAENDACIVIKDIAPKAPIHYLIIPKKHIVSIHNLLAEDEALMGKLMLTAQQVAATLPEPKAFQLVFNNGKQAGQSVFHLHAHLLAGRQVADL
jgi:diadenosine tetraphosphate (Ap4A) HIT family hydrolase